MAVYQAGSFTKAAQDMHLTQAAVSGLVKDLEGNLELRLFERTTRKLDLSETGKSILPAVARVLSELDAMHDEVKRVKNLEQGTVRIAVTQQLASAILPGIINTFNAMHPYITVNVTDCGVEMVQQCVRDAVVDIGVGPERELGDDLTRDLLFELPFHLVMQPGHPFTKLETLRWSDLKSEELITLSGSFAELISDDLLRKSAAHLVNPKYKVSFMSTALSMVQSGLGVTLCLPYVSDWVAQNKLVMLPLQDPVIKRKFYLYSRKRSIRSPATEKFLELFVTEINGRYSA